MRLTSTSRRRSQSIDAEYLAGQRFPYQEDISLVEDVDLDRGDARATTSTGSRTSSCSQEDGTPAVFDRYSNSFIKIYFPIPEGREDEIARKVLIDAPADRATRTGSS